MHAPSEDPTRAPSRSDAARWVRLVLVLAVGLGILAPVLFVLAYFSFAGARFGWISSALAFTTLGAGIGWAATSSRWRLARRRALTALAAAGALGGVATAHVAPPTPGRLRHEIETLVPSGWTLEAESVDGTAFCFDYCTTVSRTYRVHGELRDVVADVRPTLPARCIVGLPELRPTYWSCPADGDGDVNLSLELAAQRDGTTLAYITAGF
ncbi:MAG: hypothetical protein ACT4OV_05540 [Microthrixaceae bacterium]